MLKKGDYVRDRQTGARGRVTAVMVTTTQRPLVAVGGLTNNPGGYPDPF